MLFRLAPLSAEAPTRASLRAPAGVAAVRARPGDTMWSSTETSMRTAWNICGLPAPLKTTSWFRTQS